MAFYDKGTRVQITNKKHKQFGQIGTISDMDRGNVYVKLDAGKTICTRMNALSELGLLDKLAEAANEKEK